MCIRDSQKVGQQSLPKHGGCCMCFADGCATCLFIGRILCRDGLPCQIQEIGRTSVSNRIIGNWNGEKELRQSKRGGQSVAIGTSCDCLLYTSPSPRDRTRSRMPSSAWKKKKRKKKTAQT
eukprot:TRINITY_DN29711_c0_g1_i1.p1 TRINITY_DN29711_c0_g1~~TRINITY_DN29711_c0_g1_i1.p1  ORF type:complete len:121 (-),score=33.80 TRINITY_DN29711_c0_g1_i1:71-433(-)